MSYLNLCPSYYPDKTYTKISTVDDKKAKNPVGPLDLRLPLPNQLDYSSEFNWSADTISLGASTIIDSTFENVNARNFSSENALNMVTSLASGIKEGGTILAGEALRGLAKTTFDKVAGPALNTAGIDLNANKLERFGLSKFNLTYNPNEVLYFNGVSHRTFMLAFDIVPLNSKQADEAATAIHKLRVSASPGFDTGKVFFTYPSYFSIDVMVNGNTLIQRPKFVIRGMNTNLAPGGVMSWHEDGKPVAFTLQIDCMEAEITTADDERKRKFMGITV